MANTAQHTSGHHAASSSAAESVHQHHFMKVFVGVMIVLTIFTLACVAIARMLAPTVDADSDTILRTQLEERIAPVGKVITSADELDTPETTATTDSAPKTGPELVAANCSACHTAGVAGAPKSDDDAEWSKRRSAGLDALVASVINGKGNMAPRAGTQLSDEEIRLAVQHLAGFETDDSASAAPASSETTTEAVSDSAAVTAVAGAIEGLTEPVKTIADTLCSSCHISGVSGAPKLGDKAAWDERAEKGLDGMIKVVVTGKNAMPPRGGSSLSDEEIGVAIEYLMSK